MSNSDVQLKLVLLGDSAVGKSSIVLRFCKNQYSDQAEPTIGASFINHDLEVDESEVKLQIWDTAGQERFHSLAPMYYRGAKGAVIVYDITRLESFERAKDWVKEIQEKGSKNAKIALVGNKIDLNEYRVETEIAEKYATENGLLFFEASAKTGIGISEIFVGLSKVLPKTPIEDDLNSSELSSDEVVNLEENDLPKKKSGGCC
eukprot:Anaeramoba_flamelloidesc42527_g3_i1.p1 GENE.c42527_g3_i1~~c42527_g3_i1.p1  ORF type:complete len:204 (+),score=43.38 c42527_g3_i1:10-621(+)